MTGKAMSAGGAANPLDDLDWELMKAHLDQFKQDSEFLDSIAPELLKQCPDCWVAVYQKKVVATGQDLKDVMRQLHDGNIPAPMTVLEFLPSEPIPTIVTPFFGD